METTIYSNTGREYAITFNQSMDICIIMDCMTPEAQDEKFDNKLIYYNFVNYIHGSIDDLHLETVHQYINEYEKNLTVTVYDYQCDEEYQIYKGI